MGRTSDYVARCAVALAPAALAAACSAPFEPVSPPHAGAPGFDARVMDLKMTESCDPPGRCRFAADVRVERDPAVALTGAQLARNQDPPCTAGLRTLPAASGAAPPLPLEYDHTLPLQFPGDPESALAQPSAIDLSVREADGRSACVRLPLGDASQWERPHWSIQYRFEGAVPLRTLGAYGSAWTLGPRIGRLVGPVDVNAGPLVGFAPCSACDHGYTLLLGVVAAMTAYPVRTRSMALGVELSMSTIIGEAATPGGGWYQAPGLSLQLLRVGPRGDGRTVLPGRDFTVSGFELYEQVWIPTLDGGRPASLVGLGWVKRFGI
jgi:hypothetical protein